MSKEVKATIMIEDAYRVTAWYKDFDGDLAKWKEAYYDLWRWQMTYTYAHEINVHEVHSGDVIVSLLVKPEYKDNVLRTMEGLGYKRVKCSEESVGLVPLYDVDDPAVEDVFTVVAD